MLKIRKAVILVLLSLMACNVSALSIGAAPGVKDISTVERGETYEVDIYVRTNAQSPIELDPVATRPPNSFFDSRPSRSYDFKAEEASQEDISPWISFTQDTFEIDPEDSEAVQLWDGSTFRANGVISFTLEVPRGAEPGYHAARISLNPQMSSDNDGAGFQILGVSQSTLVFRVPGEARREVQILGVEGLRSGDNSARLNFRVRNTGTVTTYLGGDNATIYRSSGPEEDVIPTNGDYIKPGETKTLSSSWIKHNGEDLTAGNYRVQGTMNYITGRAFIDETFSITDFIQIESSNESGGGGVIGNSSGENRQGVPVWMIAIFLVLVGALMYAFEIDPLLIIMAIGVLGISAFIWVTGLPAMLIGIVLIITLVLLYYGWV